MSPKEQGQKMEYLCLGLDVTAPRLAFIKANNLFHWKKNKKKNIGELKPLSLQQPE